jgi:hypothetical protein
MYLQLSLLSLIILISLISLIKIFSGKVIFKTNAEYATQDLIIQKSGFYSLWVFGKILTKPNLQKFNGQIINENENRLYEMPSFFRPNSNNGSSGSVQLESYYLEKGTYKFRIGNESQSSFTYLDKTIRKILPGEESDDFGYKIKKTFPEFLFPLCLIGIIMPAMEIVKMLTEK